MRENGKAMRTTLLRTIMKWISIEAETLLDIYNSYSCTDVDKQIYMARISELSIVRLAILDIFSEEKKNG